MRAAAKLRAQAKFSDMQNQAKIAEDARELERVQREAKEAQQRKELWEADWEKRRTQLLGEEVRRFSQADSQRLLGDDAQTEDTESTISKATQKWRGRMAMSLRILSSSSSFKRPLFGMLVGHHAKTRASTSCVLLASCSARAR